MSTPVEEQTTERSDRARPHPFSVDARSLALFRIGLGVALLQDLAARLPDLEAHYTDLGILPRAALPPFGRLALPLHRMTGAAWGEGLLFALAAVIAVALIVGWRTRIMTALSWTMLLSLHGRNELVLSGGDPLLRVALFWSMFMPLGAWLAIDARGAAPKRELRSVGVTVFLAQVAAMYFFTGVLKLEEHPWRSGLALGSVLRTYHLATPLGASLLAWPRLVRALTYGTMALEILAPLGLFWIWPRRALVPVRIATLLALFALQVGIAITMPVGNFQPISILVTIPFVPSVVWDRLSPRLAARAVDEAPAPPSSRASRVLDWTAGTLGLYVLACNVGTVVSDHDLPGRPERLAYMLGIDQRWNMFVMTSGLATMTGWMVVPAKLEDGAVVDLLTGREPLSWDMPNDPRALYGDWRWRRYVTKWVWSNDARFRPPYAEYLCRKWNAGHPSRRAAQVQLVRVWQLAPETGELGPPHRASLFRAVCPGITPRDAEP